MAPRLTAQVAAEDLPRMQLLVATSFTKGPTDGPKSDSWPNPQTLTQSTAQVAAEDLTLMQLLVATGVPPV